MKHPAGEPTSTNTGKRKPNGRKVGAEDRHAAIVRWTDRIEQQCRSLPSPKTVKTAKELWEGAPWPRATTMIG